MKRPHFALPEIYDDSLSYYDVLRKLIKSMHVISDNLNKIHDQIANEAKARFLGDQNLQQNINAETSAREQADQGLQTNIDNEEQARTESDNALQTNIDNEVTARQESDNELRELIRTSGGGVTEEQLIEEATARRQGDITLQNNINSETSAREQADREIRAGVSDKISELKGDIANKLPKSPANWESWTSDEQAVARERMGIPGDYELIEKITVTEDLQEIERSYDLDGNMYKFRSILLISKFPKAADGRDKIENFRVTAILNNNKYVDAFTSYKLNDIYNISYQLIQNQNGFYNIVISSNTTNKGHLDGYPAKISSSFELGDYIKSIRIETTLSENIYRGTVIEIYGVRA